MNIFEETLDYYLEINGNIDYLRILCCKLLNKCFKDTKKYMKEKGLEHMSNSDYATIRNYILYDDSPENVFKEISDYECNAFRACENEVANIRKNIKNINNDMQNDEKMLHIIEHLDDIKQHVTADIRQILMNNNINHFNNRLNDERYPRFLYKTIRRYDERLYNKMCFINKLQQIQERNSL